MALPLAALGDSGLDTDSTVGTPCENSAHEHASDETQGSMRPETQGSILEASELTAGYVA